MYVCGAVFEHWGTQSCLLFFHISTFSGIAEELQINLKGSEHNANTEWDRTKVRRNTDHGSARNGNNETAWHPELQENFLSAAPWTGTFPNLPRPHTFMVISVNLVFNPAQDSFWSLGKFRVGWVKLERVPSRIYWENLEIYTRKWYWENIYSQFAVHGFERDK